MDRTTILHLERDTKRKRAAPPQHDFVGAAEPLVTSRAFALWDVVFFLFFSSSGHGAIRCYRPLKVDLTLISLQDFAGTYRMYRGELGRTSSQNMPRWKG